MSRKKRKGNIQKQHSPENAIPKQYPIKQSDGFSFSPIYFNWLKGTDRFYKTYEFTNMVKDAEEFSHNLAEIATEFIPKLYAEHKQIFNNNYYNCHPVTGDKKELVIEIAEDIHQAKFNEEDLKQARIQWWYLGFKANIRLVGLYNWGTETFYPMFIDHHHLIHGNTYYNLPDFEKYSYCPIYSYENS